MPQLLLFSFLEWLQCDDLDLRSTAGLCLGNVACNEVNAGKVVRAKIHTDLILVVKDTKVNLK